MGRHGIIQICSDVSNKHVDDIGCVHAVNASVFEMPTRTKIRNEHTQAIQSRRFVDGAKRVLETLGGVDT